MSVIAFCLLICGLLLGCSNGGDTLSPTPPIHLKKYPDPYHIEIILKDVPVSPQGDLGTFPTRLDYQNGYLITAYVDKAPTGQSEPELRQQTIIMLGKFTPNGWQWQKHLIDAYTLKDPYHTQPSVAFDKEGYIHIAYGMHNMPWQYFRSTKPYSIDAFENLGTPLSIEQKRTIHYQNQTHFPQLNSGAIPYNQITYPRFFKDKKQTLYITYRFALKPKLAWENRAFSEGLAQYNTETQTWHPIGGKVSLTSKEADFTQGEGQAYPFIYDHNHSPFFLPYWLELTFDHKNQLYAIWSWRQGQAGKDTQDLSFVQSPNLQTFTNEKSQSYTLPINKPQTVPLTPARKKYFNTKHIQIFNGHPLILAESLEGTRELYYLSNQNQWQKLSSSPPQNGGEIMVTYQNTETLWSFASGVIYKKTSIDKPWRQVASFDSAGKKMCFVQALPVEEQDAIFLYGKTCNSAEGAEASFSLFLLTGLTD